MTRAALLPTPADPFLIDYWMKFFTNGWDKYVDRLYVYLNAPTESEVIDYIIKQLEKHPKITYLYNNTQTDHGIALKALLDICGEDLVMFIEDDGYIFKPEIVDLCFAKLESGEFDIVGSKRGSCHPSIYTRAQSVFGVRENSYDADHGPNFWPNFFFTRADLLRNTDGNFCGKAWLRGEVIKELANYEIEDEVVYSDTFVWGSIQLRTMVLEGRIFYVPQYHGHPSDPDFYMENKGLFDGNASWTHVGSLSSGICGVIRDQFNRPLAYRTTKEMEERTKLPLEWCSTDMERGEWERRVCFWEMAFDHFVNTETEDSNAPILEFAEHYKNGLNNIIRQYGLHRTSINNRKNIYKSIGL